MNPQISAADFVRNFRSMLRDETLYPDAAKFKPERFMEKDPEKRRMMDPRNYIFGFGRRWDFQLLIIFVFFSNLSCLGYVLARTWLIQLSGYWWLQWSLQSKSPSHWTRTPIKTSISLTPCRNLSLSLFMITYFSGEAFFIYPIRDIVTNRTLRIPNNFKFSVKLKSDIDLM